MRKYHLHRIATAMAVAFCLLGLMSSARALTDDQINRLAFFTENFRTIAPSTFRDFAVFESIPPNVLESRMREFSQVLRTDPYLSSASSNAQALRTFFSYYYGKTIPADPANYDNDFEGYFSGETLHALIRSVSSELQRQTNDFRRHLIRGTATHQTKRFLTSLNAVLKLRFQGKGPDVAGELSPEAFLQNAQITLGGSYAWIKDGSLEGNGSDRDVSLFATAGYGDDWMYGIGLTMDRYEINGFLDFEQTNILVDLFATRYIGAGISLGGFFNYTNSEIADRTTTYFDTEISIGGSSDRIGAGILVNGLYTVKGWDVSATATLASMNKPNVQSLANKTDSAAIFQASASHAIYAGLSGEVYATWIQIINNDDADTDRGYANLGVQFYYPLTEHLTIDVGFEKSVARTNYEDNRISADLAYSW